MRTLTGKIGRLPPGIRDDVCRRLYANKPASRILPWLNSLPQVRAVLQDLFDGANITSQNLSEFKTGPGFADWIKRQTKIADTKALSSFMMEMARASDGNLTEGAVAVTAGKLIAKLESADSDDLEKIAKAIADLRNTDIDTIKLKQNNRKLKQAARKLELEETKFRRQTVELFLDWFDDREAKAIAQSTDGKEIKMERLISRIWGKRPDNIKQKV